MVLHGNAVQLHGHIDVRPTEGGRGGGGGQAPKTCLSKHKWLSPKQWPHLLPGAA